MYSEYAILAKGLKTSMFWIGLARILRTSKGTKSYIAEF